MKNKRLAIAMALLAVFALPSVAAAQQGVSDSTQGVSDSVQGVEGPINLPDNSGTQRGTGIQGGISNPIGVDSLVGFFYKIANFVYSLSYAVIAFFLIWSGLKFVLAQGNDTKLQDAKRTFMYTIIGAILLIGAQVLTEVMRTVIDQFTNNPT